MAIEIVDLPIKDADGYVNVYQRVVPNMVGQNPGTLD